MHFVKKQLFLAHQVRVRGTSLGYRSILKTHARELLCQSFQEYAHVEIVPICLQDLPVVFQVEVHLFSATVGK